MKFRWKLALPAFFVIALVVAPRAWAQGPPFQVDDPVPVDYRHYEFYIFGGADGTPAEMDFLPWGGIYPSNNPVYLPGGTGPSAFGLTDMELGVKLAIFKETKTTPQIGTFTMFEMPTGNYDKGLGMGKVWYKLPLWLQKNQGKWLFDGGAGETVVPQTGYHDFTYGGFLLKRELSERLELAAEVFSHGGEGSAAAQTQSSTMIDAGGYWHLKKEPDTEFFFAYGHSIAGQTENYAYAGIYWTWGKDDKNADDKDAPDKKAQLKDALYSRQAMKHGF
jgi:hypothetical protein